MDEEADAGDHAEHDEGEVVDGEGEVDLEAGDGDPAAKGGTTDYVDDFGRACGLHREPEPDPEGGWDGSEEQGNGGDEGAGQLAADGSVDEEAGEGKQRDQPEIRSGHQYFSNLKVSSG